MARVKRSPETGGYDAIDAFVMATAEYLKKTNCIQDAKRSLYIQSNRPYPRVYRNEP